MAYNPFSADPLPNLMLGSNVSPYYDPWTMRYNLAGAAESTGALGGAMQPASGQANVQAWRTAQSPSGQGATSPLSLTPAPASNWSAAYGGIPQVPSYIDTTGQAVRATTENMPGILDLARQINAFNLAEQTGQYTAGIPEYAGTEAQLGLNRLAAAQGTIPESVKQQLQQAAAERGLAQGTTGSRFNTNDYLRSLGLSALAQQQWAEQAQTGAVARMPRVNLFNPAQYTITPEQAQQAQYQANLLNAAPIPSAAAAANMAAANRGIGQGGNAYAIPSASPARTSASQIPNSILARYAPTAGITQPPGWGMLTGPTGTVEAYGNQVFPVSNYNPAPIPETVAQWQPPNLFDFLTPTPGYQDYSALEYLPTEPYPSLMPTEDYSGIPDLYDFLSEQGG